MHADPIPAKILKILQTSEYGAEAIFDPLKGAKYGLMCIKIHLDVTTVSLGLTKCHVHVSVKDCLRFGEL